LIKKVTYIIISLILVSCDGDQSFNNKVIINPNPSSEMAVLMRKMSMELELIKPKLENAENLNLLHFDSIHLHKTTDNSFNQPHIKSMSSSFAISLSKFNKNPSKANYSSIINNCLNCHQQSCPGPISRINRLLIEP
jgi:hypothetical protein